MFQFNSILLKKFNNANKIIFRNKKWYPDPEFFSQFDGIVMYPDEVRSKWKPLYNSKKEPFKETVIKNMKINFGPQHPAAHGVLRLILELEGEVPTRII